MNLTDKMGRPIPFDLEYVTANLSKGTGGDTKTASKFVKLRGKTTNAKTNANHFLNNTINIMPLGGGPITKVHVMLIKKFNNSIVV